MNRETTKFLQELKQRPDVLGVIMFGSWARGNHRPDSDVDLVVILTDGFRRTVEHRNEQAFEIIYTAGKAAFDYWESHKDEAARLWDVAKILYDKDGAVERLRNQIKVVLDAGKEPIDEFRLGQLRFDAEDLLKYVASNVTADPTTENLVLTNKIFVLTELFFDIRRMWTPAPKQRLAKIKEISPRLYSLLQQFYREQIALKAKLEIAKEIIPLIFET